jgi:hypothetical protein
MTKPCGTLTGDRLDVYTATAFTWYRQIIAALYAQSAAKASLKPNP